MRATQLGQAHCWLHKLTPLENADVCAAQLEPFSIFALRSEALMPIRLNTNWIICPYTVNSSSLFGQLNF